MTSPLGRLHVIVNPRAGRGGMTRSWPSVARVLADAGLDHDVTFTERPGHATQAARQAVEDGCGFVVAVGGDGTVHEVVNGLMGDEKPLNPDVVFGIVPAGTGSDFAKMFGLPADPVRAAAHLAGDNLWGRLDVARITCAGMDAPRWYINVGEAGLGAAVVARAAKLPRWLGGNVYRFAALREIVRMRPVQATIVMHGRKARGSRVDAPLGPIKHEGPLDLLIVANCQWFGGGMHVAPRAIPEDGMLDILIVNVKRSDAAGLMQKMFKAKHIPNPDIAEFLAERVEVTTSQPILVEVDGEVVGTTPATFDLVPAAIPFKI